MPSFEIADCPTTLSLAPAGGDATKPVAGTLSLTVRNATDRRRTGRVLVEPDATSKPEWFALDTATTSPRELELDFEPRATRTAKVVVSIPPGASGGAHILHVRVTAEQDPDNDFVESGAVAFTIPDPPKVVVVPPKKFPWWIVAVGGGVAVAAVAAFLLFPRGLPQPDLSKQPVAAARAELVKDGYADADITAKDAAPPTGQDPGTVVSTDYSQSGKPVLTVDPGVLVPPLIRQKLVEVAPKLAASKITLNAIAPVNLPGFADDTIAASSLREGSRVRSGAAIDLQVQQTPPNPTGPIIFQPRFLDQLKLANPTVFARVHTP